MQHDSDQHSLHDKVEQMLTEARVMLPGAQALLGFQMAILLTSAFDKLPSSSKIAHTAALLCIALTIVLLIMPAAVHRIAYAGNDSEEFHRFGSKTLVVAAVPLAAGLALDLYVGVTKALESEALGLAVGIAGVAVLIGLWFVIPFATRKLRA